MTGSEPQASRRPLWMLLALFFVPLAIAFAFYYGGWWRPQGSTEHGDLIHPARPLPTVALTRPDGGATSAKFLQERWSLVFIGSGDCNARCRSALADMQRVRELLGKDIARVQSVFLVSDKCCDRSLSATYPALIVARVDADQAAPLLAQFPIYDNVPLSEAGRIYVVDPLGNLMMSYAPEASSIGIYEDLKKLLKLSHIG